jgi:hypothetical protein
MALQRKSLTVMWGFFFGQYRDENVAGSAERKQRSWTFAEVAKPQSQMALHSTYA